MLLVFKVPRFISTELASVVIVCSSMYLYLVVFGRIHCPSRTPPPPKKTTKKKKEKKPVSYVSFFLFSFRLPSSPLLYHSSSFLLVSSIGTCLFSLTDTYTQTKTKFQRKDSFQGRKFSYLLNQYTLRRLEMGHILIDVFEFESEIRSVIPF